MKKTKLTPIIDRRLSSIHFQRQEAVLQGLQRTVTKSPARHFRLIPALALLLALLLAGAALALGLHLSARMDARQQAMKALETAFGLNEETISLFDVQVQQDGESWLVRLIPKSIYPGQVGEYQVIITKNNTSQAIWSLQGSPEYAPDKGLISPVWGQNQLLEYKRAVQNYHNRLSQVDWSKADEWSLEERAQVDHFTQSALPFRSEAYAAETHVVPNKEDLQPEAAWQLAAQALADKYGLSLNYVNSMRRGNQSFLESRADKSRWYAMTFKTSDDEDDKKEERCGESFYILLSSPGGKLLRSSWFQTDDSKRSLPDGNLKSYREAVEEYMDTEAFRYLTPGQKADVAQRITSAGFEELLGGAKYLEPDAGHASQTAALRQAMAALTKKFGLPQESLDMFITNFSLQEINNTAQWVLHLSPRQQYLTFIGPETLIGEYNIKLNAQADKVLSAQWSLQDIDNKTYDRSTWGQAKAYAGYILPWLEELMEKSSAIYKAADDEYFLNVEEAFRHDQLFREAGFPETHYNAGLPGKEDLNEQAAVNLALEALYSIYNLPANDQECFDLIWPSYMLKSNDQPFQSQEPFWIISFHRGDGIYVVALDAKTGQILHVNYDPLASGNG